MAGWGASARPPLTSIAVLQRLIFFRDLEEDFFEGGVHQAKAGEVQLIQTVLQVLQSREEQEEIRGRGRGSPAEAHSVQAAAPRVRLGAAKGNPLAQTVWVQMFQCPGLNRATTLLPGLDKSNLLVPPPKQPANSLLQIRFPDPQR